MGHINIEIKARCSNQNKIRDILYSYQAEFKGTDHQVDTYFKVNSGRLKLREGNIENYLIFYERENIEGTKQSNVILFSSNPKTALKKILVKSLGVLMVVEKQREIYFIENVKFHLDNVQNLGNFMEIEAIDKDCNIGADKLREQCEYYCSLFGIKKEDLLADSYSDLLLKVP
ncbi:MAG: class IV adenylate cyclase [Parcubacteria group bacterium]|nr:class IV adenylate cyclase [Parcubacteria group bacterium]